VRRALYGALGKGDIKDVPALAEQVMSVLLRERP
jgi:hypothetical protein